MLGVGCGISRRGTSLGPNLIENGDFSAWTSDDPDNWTIYSPPEVSEHEEVTQGPNGGARLFSDSGTVGIQQYDAGFVVGREYQVELDVLDATSGAVYVRYGASDYFSADAVGHHVFRILSAATNLQLYVLGGSDIEIDNVTARQVL